MKRSGMGKQWLAGLVGLAVLGAAGCAPEAREPGYDLVITGARVVDGTGNPWFQADVAIWGDSIAAVGHLPLAAAHRTIDARGLVLAPGFIDLMGGRTFPLLEDPESADSKLRQGITTMLAGEGTSPAPQNERTLREVAAAGRLGLAWQTYRQYFDLLEKTGMRLNVIHNVGAAQVRKIVLGEEDKEPTAADLEEMKRLVDQAMRDGAAGLSTALIYPPGTYATTGELVELAKVAAEHGGVYFTHMRNESNQLLEAIGESIEIGEKAGLPVHIYHLKAAGQENWPLMAKAIGRIAEARDRGLDVTADIYPYIRNGLGLRSFLHPRHFAAGGEAFLKTLSDPKVRMALRREVETTSDWENWYRHVGRNWDNVLVSSVSSGFDKAYEGKSIAEIARMRRSDAWTTVFDLIQGGGVEVNPKSMNEEQKHLALKAEWVGICTDAWPVSPASATGAHPRAFGAFPRVIAQYVRQDQVVSLEGAIRRMTSLAANRLGLWDRGRIAPGLKADLVLFDYDNIQDEATFEKPMAYPAGIPYVIVNGKLAIAQGNATEERAGRVLRYRSRARQ